MPVLRLLGGSPVTSRALAGVEEDPAARGLMNPAILCRRVVLRTRKDPAGRTVPCSMQRLTWSTAKACGKRRQFFESACSAQGGRVEQLVIP